MNTLRLSAIVAFVAITTAVACTVPVPAPTPSLLGVAIGLAVVVLVPRLPQAYVDEAIVLRLFHAAWGEYGVGARVFYLMCSQE